MKDAQRAAPGCGRGNFARAAALLDMLDRLANAPLRRRVLTQVGRGRASPRRPLPDLAGFAPASKPMQSCRAAGRHILLEANMPQRIIPFLNVDAQVSKQVAG